MNTLLFVCVIGMIITGGLMAAFGVQQAVIDTGIVSLLWVIYTIATMWLIGLGIYCFIKLIKGN